MITVELTDEEACYIYEALIVMQDIAMNGLGDPSEATKYAEIGQRFKEAGLDTDRINENMRNAGYGGPK